jgi:hypothetical protein
MILDQVIEAPGVLTRFMTYQRAHLRMLRTEAHIETHQVSHTLHRLDFGQHLLTLPDCSAHFIETVTDNSFPLTPEHTLSANLTYAWEMLELNWSATASYMYNDEQYTTAFNVDEYDLICDWDRWDARLSVASPEGVWEVIAYAKNIGDDLEVRLRSRPNTTTNNIETSLTDPRMLGLRAIYNF